MKEILDLIPGTMEFRMKQLEESARNVSLMIPECPVKWYINISFRHLVFIIFFYERFALRSSRKMEEFSAARMVTFCVDLASLMTPFGYFSLTNQNCISKNSSGLSEV